MSSGSAAGTALVGGRVALLLDGDLNSVFLRRLKDAVFAADPVDAVFHVLSEAGLRNLPSFACIIRDDIGIRLLLRGSVAAFVRTYGGDERTIKGEAVSTWAEHVIRDPREVTLQSISRTREEKTLVLLFEQRDSASRARNRRRPEAAQSPAPAPAPLAPVVDVAPLPAPVAAPPPPPAPPPVPPPPPPAPAPAPVPRAREGSGEPTIVPQPEPSPPRDDDAWPAPAPAAAWMQTDGEFDFSHLLEQTKFKDVEAAAVREAVADAPAPWDAGGLIDAVPSKASRPEPAGIDGDHDGHTVSVPRGPVTRPPRPPATGALLRPIVQAVRCARGHANPPSVERCASCGGPIPDRRVVQVERPVLGRLRFSDGMVVDLDRPLVLGRKPDHAPAGKIGGEDPGLIALPDPDRALSRVHAEVRLEDWHVLVVDRRSANGTVVEIPGEDAMQLHPDQPCLITTGTRVNLAEVISFTFEAPPA